jgi:hypothetical protein
MEIPHTVLPKLHPDGELHNLLRTAVPDTRLDNVYVYMAGKYEKSLVWSDLHLAIVQNPKLQLTSYGRPTNEPDMYAHPRDAKAPRFEWSVSGPAGEIMKLIQKPEIDFAGKFHDIDAARKASGLAVAK